MIDFFITQIIENDLLIVFNFIDYKIIKIITILKIKYLANNLLGAFKIWNDVQATPELCKLEVWLISHPEFQNYITIHLSLLYMRKLKSH